MIGNPQPLKVNAQTIIKRESLLIYHESEGIHFN